MQGTWLLSPAPANGLDVIETSLSAAHVPWLSSVDFNAELRIVFLIYQ